MSTIPRLLLVVALFGLANGMALPGLLRMAKHIRDASVDKYLSDVINQFAQSLTVGIPSLGIPVLDPLHIPVIDIPTINQDAVTLDADIKDLDLVGLSGISTQSLAADLENLRLVLDLALPSLKAKGKYSMNGVIVGIFPVYGDGPFAVSLSGLSVQGEGSFLIDTEGKMKIVDLCLGASFQSISVNFENLLGGGSLGEVLNKILSVLGKTIFDKVKPHLIDKVNKALLDVINDQLSNVSLQEIIDGATPVKYIMEQQNLSLRTPENITMQ